MSDTMQLSGHCLCGAVTITANQADPHVGACHCSMCRRWGGGPLMVVECGTDVQFEGADSIAVYDSSDWAERGFCRQCGSHLFYRLKEANKHFMPAGLFGDHPEWVFDHQVFIDSKPGFYSFANETKDMTEVEVFAMFAPAEK
jgi:hypothetical protein